MWAKAQKSADRMKTLSAKAAYSKAANQKLAETKRKLDGVNAKIGSAVSMGQIDATEQLKRAQHAVDLILLSAEQRIEELRKSGEHEWTACADDVDSAWEDLSQSVKRLVARFSDMAK